MSEEEARLIAQLAASRARFAIQHESYCHYRGEEPDLSQLSERLRRWWYQDGECMMAKDMREAADRIEELERRVEAAESEVRGHVAAAELADKSGITAFRSALAASSPCCAEKRELELGRQAVLAECDWLEDYTVPTRKTPFYRRIALEVARIAAARIRKALTTKSETTA